MGSSGFFLFLTLVCVFLEGFFAMFEMAAVSFNRARLQYYASKNSKRAIWIKSFIDHPSRLFGTTIIAIDFVLQIGSEASRQFYESIGFSPDLAPLTQVVVVVIFAELAPMFAARRCPEHSAMLLVPVVYVISKLLIPFVWLIDLLSKGIDRFFEKKPHSSLFLTKEEVQKAFEEKDKEKDNVSRAVGNIFSLKRKTAREFMLSLDEIILLSQEATIVEARTALRERYFDFIPIYRGKIENIIAISYPRDMINAKNDEILIHHSETPWFISDNSLILSILHQFRHNRQSVSVVLDSSGKAIGVLTIDQIFGELVEEKPVPPLRSTLIERTFSGEMLLSDFNRQFGTKLFFQDTKTLGELMIQALGHHPAKGEILNFGQFELVVEETSILGIKTILVRTVVF